MKHYFKSIDIWHVTSLGLYSKHLQNLLMNLWPENIAIWHGASSRQGDSRFFKWSLWITNGHTL